MKRFSLFLIAAVLLCASCRKDSESNTTNITYPDHEIWVNTSILGVVVDGNDEPLENASITVGMHSQLTDDNGVFYFKDITANEAGTVIEVELHGFFSTSTVIYPQLNSVSSVKIKLLKSDGGGFVQSTSGGEVSIGQGASVEFPANAFEQNGAPYSGQVEVKGVWIDPTDAELFEKMPGNLLGIDANKRLRGMATFGMIGVELFDGSGRTIELADGMMATLKFPVPDVILAEAPGEIPLWHYDMQNGYWMEEGSAKLEGNMYVGQVAHFSFWNCDDPFETVELSGNIVNEDGEPYSGIRITLKRNTTTNNTGYAVTNEYGFYSGKIPKGEMLKMLVEDVCDNVVLSKDIGPFNSDIKLSDETVMTPGDFKVLGRLLNCTSDPVSNGYALVEIEGLRQILSPKADGTFEGYVSSCGGSPEVSVVGKDLDAFEQGVKQTFTYTNPLDCGDVIACGNVLPHLKISIDGVLATIEPCWAWASLDSLPNGGGLIDVTSISAEDPTGGYYQMAFDGITTGEHDIYRLYGGNVNSRFENLNITTNVTTYGSNSGDFVIGTFSGTAYDAANQKTVDVSGSYVGEVD